MSQEDYKEDSDLGDMPDPMDESLFWSMTLEPTKSQEIGEPAIDGYVVHITNACFGADVSKHSRTVVTVNDQEKAIPVCILRQGHHENHSLDLLFNEAATITLTGNKVSTVYLTGYIQPPLDMNESDAVMDEDMTEAEIMEALTKQRRQQMLLDDEVFDDEENQENKNKKQEVDDDEDMEEEEEEEEEELIEEVAEEEVVEPPTKKQKTNKGSKSTKNGSKSEKMRKTPAPKAKAKAVQKSVEKEDDTKEEEETVVAVEQKNKGKNKKKGKKDKKLLSMKGGIKYRDMKVGEGAEVSVGDKLSVFYVGQTEDKKVFDKAIKGSGFEFNFGKGDVIKGWDMGLKGMKVGGKRKLVIPPKLAYGANGSPPQVPGNATLTFTIELKAVN